MSGCRTITHRRELPIVSPTLRGWGGAFRQDSSGQRLGRFCHTHSPGHRILNHYDSL